MNKQIFTIPEGIYYLTQIPEILNNIPDYCIFNKVMTGCGATTLFLDDHIPTVLCVPRVELALCKANSRMFKGIVHLFGSESYEGKDIAVIDKIRNMKDYVRSISPVFCGNRAPKIIVTYDSTKHVIQGLSEIGVLDKFRFVVDEFQTIFTDAAFRGDTEAEFMQNLTHTKSVIFLSATPYLEEYLDLLDEFKDLDYIELKWPESSTHPTYIKSKRYIEGSPNKTIQNIIEKYRKDGYFEETMDETGNIHKSNEAVFFVNNVKFIINTIQKNKLSPSEVNIICSTANNNYARLKKEKLTIGHAPKEGEPHCPFTFVTKAAYEGVDFYSPCAYTYIFSDIRMDNLAIDISLDLAQIMGRQRLLQNIFKYSATFFFKQTLKYEESDEEEFKMRVQNKCDETISAVNDFENCSDDRKKLRDARKYKNSQTKEMYENDYISVVEDNVTKMPKMIFNKYVMVNEIRAWQVQKDQYLNATRVMASVNNTFSKTQTSNTLIINSFLRQFTGSFEDKMKLYAEFIETHPECKLELQQIVEIPTNIKTYYNTLGFKKLRALSWKESAIKAAIMKPDNIEDRVKQTFTESWYSLSEIKILLQEIYDDCCPGTKAKAVDLNNYFVCKERKRTIHGKREKGYEIVNL